MDDLNSRRSGENRVARFELLHFELHLICLRLTNVGRVRDNDVESESQSLYLVAPALDHYRHLVARIRYRSDLVYPVAVFAECFNTGGSESSSRQLSRTLEGENAAVEADSDVEFMTCLRIVFRSPEVATVIRSLIARSNDRPLGNGESTEDRGAASS